MKKSYLDFDSQILQKIKEEKFSAISQLQTLHSTAVLESDQKHLENLRHVRIEMESIANERKIVADSDFDRLKEKLARTKEELFRK